MFLDTHSQNSMVITLSNFLNIEKDKLFLCLNSIFYKSKDYEDDGMILNELLNNFIKKQNITDFIDKCLFFHLGRRLADADSDYEGKNLRTLLLTENPFSSFLKNHFLAFSEEEHLIIVYKGKQITLDNLFDSEVCYLRSRLGYNINRQDYCFNGFALKDQLFMNDYARRLLEGPEFIRIISHFLGNDSILSDYIQQSKYYCYEYLLPFIDVTIDGISGNKGKSNAEKTNYLLLSILRRLISYKQNLTYNFRDRENPVLLFNDYSNVKSIYFVSKQEITKNMLVL